MFRIGIDLGGTKIEGIVLDKNGKELFRRRIDTEQQRGYLHILNRINNLYRDLCTAIPGKPHTLGIGTPGAISQRTGLLKNSNTVCLNGQPLKVELERILGHPIAIQNDANCFAMAEALYGAGRGKNLVFGVIMGTGCGGGIVYKGEVFTGPQSIAGEWGHMSINPAGPLCYCGQRGCVETYVSGGGLEKRYAEQFLESRRFKDIAQDYYENEPRAVEFIRVFLSHFGRSIANLIDVLDPD
ncbi:MAG TPA: ROK family protein, partial [Candidatus Paceibacterota bacterium]|nr:ROK family protein [Candidatus Paceibacterota bacterium]